MFRLVFVFLMVVFSFGSAQAQQQIDPGQLIPPREYDIFIDRPEDFYMAYRAGAFPNYLEEFIPVGEEIENWSEMYSIGYLGPIAGRDFSEFGNHMIALARSQCQKVEVFLNEINRVEGNLESIEVGYLCIGQDPSMPPNNPEIVLKEYEVIFMRYVFIEGNIHAVQRAWHGSKEDFEAFKDFEYQVNQWQADLDRFSICKFRDLDNTCWGIDLEDKSDNGRGKDFAFLVINPKDSTSENPNRFLNTIVYPKDDITKVKSAINTANKILAAYNSGLSSMILIQFEQLPEFDSEGSAINRDYAQARVDIYSFVGLVYDLLSQNGVPTDKIGFAFSNLHPKLIN